APPAFPGARDDSEGGIASAGPNDVWTNGTIGKASVTSNWNGRRWTRVPNPLGDGGSITIDPTGMAWTTGQRPRGRTTLLHLCAIPREWGDLYVFTPPPSTTTLPFGSRASFRVRVWDS